jgi:[ribosomal protein S18]-alanine N-acetyltransferase
VTALAIRPLEPRDIPAILELQNSCREAAQWPESAYRDLDRAGESAWLAEQNGNIAGFLVARIVAAEMEILNLAVRASLRRQGIATALLRDSLLWGVQAGARRAFLEVRSSNTAARQFYAAHGFSLAGSRRNYYRAPDEDALILSRALDGI